MTDDRPPFENPFASVPLADKTRTTVEIDNRVKSRIERVHPKGGVLQKTIYIFLTKLTNELDRLHITDYDPPTYERAIAGMSIGLGGYHAIITGDKDAPDARTTNADTGERYSPIVGRPQRGSFASTPTRRRPAVANKTPNRDDRPRAKRVGRKPTGPSDASNP